MSGPETTCRGCAAPVAPADRFCENCGGALSDIARVAIPRPATAPPGPCADCGNDSYVDDYCGECGNLRAEPDRDVADLGGIVLVSDRGLEHARNEDAAAAGLVGPAGSRPWAAAAAVCDGVSTSSNAHTAAAAASTAGVDAMLAALAACRSGRAAVLVGLAEAARAAAGAGGADSPAGPSCTYTGAVVVPTDDGAVQISVGNVGDSRAYWVPEPPAPAERLTVDDSLSQELITAGAHEESEAVQAGAHVLTRWLGADAEAKPWADSSVLTVTAAGPGSLVLCTDGLWNYFPHADDIGRLCTGTDHAATARALIDHALRCGGHDNVTVAIIPIGGSHEFA